MGNSKHTKEEMENKPTKKQVRKAFYKADKDGNGKLTAKEFKAAVLALCQNDKERKLFEKDLDKNTLDMMVSCLDANGDSMVSLEELFIILDCDTEGNEKQVLVNMIRSADKDNKDFQILIMMADLDGDRKLSIDEVARFFTDGPKKKDPKEEMRNMFRMCDVDGNGYITKKEIVKFMKLMDIVTDENDPMMARYINQMMANADKDKNGKLNYREFCRVVNTM